MKKTLQEQYNEGVALYGRECPQYTDKGTIHSYIETYQNIFDTFTDGVRILEIGIHSGGSLMLWSSYLDNYEIWALDIAAGFWPETSFQNSLKENTNLHLLFSRNSKVSQSYEDIPGEFDLIIDDGDHHAVSQIDTFIAAYPKLKVGGTYIIEDINRRYLVEEILESIGKVYPNLKYTVYYGNNGDDDTLIIFTK